MTDLERLMVEDRRYIAADNYDAGARHGIEKGLGMAADIMNECLDAVEALNKSSDGYRKACLDFRFKLLEKMKELDT